MHISKDFVLIITLWGCSNVHEVLKKQITTSNPVPCGHKSLIKSLIYSYETVNVITCFKENLGKIAKLLEATSLP